MNKNLLTKKQSFLLLFLALFTSVIFGQTTIINPATVGGFESGTTFVSNGWIKTSGTSTQTQWVVGTGATAGFSGTRCAYVTQDTGATPPPFTYDIGTTRVSHFYRDIAIPTGETDITLSFNWLGRGESSFDRMRVWIVPTTYTPSYGTEITATGTAPTGNIQVGVANYSAQTNWAAASFKLPAAYAGTTARLVFEWRNDSSLGTQPPAAIDNISLTSAVVVAPPNDLCANATNLPCGTSNLVGTTVATTNITNTSGCSMSNYGVWYTFIGDGQQTTITTNPSFDIKLSVSTGTCGSMTNIVCTDSSPETATFTTVIGTRYNIYVAYWSTSGTTTGTFTISRTCTVAPAPPANDLCANATDLPCGTTNLAGTTVATTNVTNNSGCNFMSNYGVWYTFLGDGNATTISTNPSFDIKLSIATGTCGTMTNIVCTDAAPETATFTTVNGTRYYVYVAGYGNSGTTTGTFTISRTCAGPTVPVNDLCANATNLPCGTTALAGTTVNTTNVAHGTGCTMSNYGVWYTFVGDGQPTTISSTPVSGFDHEMSIFSGNCTTKTNISCHDLSSGAGAETATFTTVNGTRYYVYIAHTLNSGTTTGAFTISRSCPNSTTYCIPTSSDSTNYISGFNTTGGVTNINNSPTGFTTGGYADYTAISVSQNPGSNFNITATHPSSTYGYKVWIDWNNDGDFDDAGENVISTGYLSSPANLGTVTIPLGQTPGNYRMRVRNAYVNNPAPACGAFNNGEAEDYTVTVINPPACTGTPTGGIVTTSPNTGWSGSLYTVSATGFTNASGLTFQWQYSTNGGTTWVNAGSLNTTYSNYNATAPTSGVVLWHLVVTCTNSTKTATSSTGTFTTMVVSDVVTGCPNVVSGGLGLNGADPATITCVSASGCVDLEATYLNLGNTSSYIVEPIIYNPPFAFSGLANPVSVNTDDVWSPIVNLPFDFCFYGNTYNKCLIGSNGVITFDTTINNTPGGTCAWSMYGSTAANLPVSGHDALVENSIFGVFHDMNPATLGEVGWQLITLPSGCRALVVSWSNVPMYSSDSANDYTGMMVLYENSNIIEVYVKKKRITTHPGSGAEGMWNDGNAVIGIQNANGTLASVPPGRNALDANWTTTNEAWRFVPNGTSIASIKWHEGAGVSGPVVGTTDVISVCPTVTTIYTAEITYTLCDGRTITEVDQTTVTVNKDKTWNGSVDTNWNVSNNWTPSGVPTAAQSVNIPNVTNDPIVGAGADAYACSLSIENGGVLTINPGKNIIVTNTVTVAAGGTFNVQNSASLIQVNNVVNSGIMNMQRTANIRKLDYVYWSSPVTFGSSFSSGAISPGSPSNLIFKWTPTIGTNVNGFGDWTQAVENMAVGKGYIVRGPNTFTATAAPYTATFIGTPNNGNITAPIQRGTYDGVNYNTIISTTPGTKDDDNWNLIGNPYPSAIKAVDFLTQNTNIDGFVNIWTHGTLPSTAIIDPFYNDYAYNYTSSDYITYNSSGASSGPGTYNGYIPAGQGFFVLMKHTSTATSENVIFNNTMRSKTYDNGQFFKNTQETSGENEGRIWLDIVAANGANVRSLVAYVDGATNDRDRLFDAVADGKLSLDLYSTIAEEPMRIQGKMIPFDQNDKVPLGFKVPQNSNYTIALAAVDGFFTNTNQNIYLEDKQTNIIHNLRQNPYQFSALSGLHLSRFILRYTNETLSTDDFNTNQATVTVISANELSVKSTKNEIKSIRIYDVLGRELANYPNVNGYEVSLTKIQKNNSGLIIQVTLTNGAVISKKAIY